MAMTTAAENLAILYRAANQLARPHAVRTRVTNPRSRTPEIVSVTHEPLITTLRAAIYGGSGANGNTSSAAPNARTVLNPVAFAHMEHLRADILASTKLLIPNLYALPKDWSEEHALSYWFDLFFPAASDGQFDGDTIDTATKVFVGWQHTILSQFVTPTVMTSNQPCPKCGEAWAIVGEGEEAIRVRAIIIHVGRSSEYHRGECRNPSCNGVWVGEDQLRQLAKDQRDIAALTNSIAGNEHNVAVDTDPVPVP